LREVLLKSRVFSEGKHVVSTGWGGNSVMRFFCRIRSSRSGRRCREEGSDVSSFSVRLTA
jgi:hypothetical protein